MATEGYDLEVVTGERVKPTLKRALVCEQLVEITVLVGGLSAGGDGLSPALSSCAKIKLSTAFCGQVVSLTCGIGCRCMGRKDQ